MPKMNFFEIEYESSDFDFIIKNIIERIVPYKKNIINANRKRDIGIELSIVAYSDECNF
jgi:hypothetical protein